MATVEGDERVIATAQQIVRSLATTETMTKDMLRILSNFDHRFSSMTEKLGGEGMEDRLATLEETLLKWDVTSADSRMIWEGPPDEAASYLEAVDEVQRLAQTLEVLSINDKKHRHQDDHDQDDEESYRLIDRAQNVLQVAMARLEEEFRNILVQQSEVFEPDRLYQRLQGPVSRVSFGNSAREDPDSPCSDSGINNNHSSVLEQSSHGVCDEEFIVDLIRPEVIPDLKDIAKRMVIAKYENECCQVYSGVRRNVLEEGLQRLGIEKLSIEDIQKMEWDILEGKIKKRIQAMKIAVRVLFASEKRLSEDVFGDLGAFKDVCFVETAKGAMMQLLNFCEAIAISRRTPEKLFRILDMYECLGDLIPDVYSVFSDDSCAGIRAETAGILVRLGEAAKGTFVEFENAIKRETSKTPIPGGAVHPLTRYVMNYLKLFFDYTDTLKNLFDGDMDLSRQPSDDMSEFSEEIDDGSSMDLSRTQLAKCFLSVASLLEANLELKAKLYKDPALSHLFLMNNARYIVQKVKGSGLGAFLGEKWIRKHSGQVRQYATSYQRAGWNKVLSCLREEGISGGSSSSKISKDAIKERFRSFNASFEDVYRVHTTWLVPDSQLREELRIAIAEKLLPAYRFFLGRFKVHIEGGRHADKYIKYTPEDLENLLLELFECTAGSTQLLRRKSSS